MAPRTAPPHQDIEPTPEAASAPPPRRAWRPVAVALITLVLAALLNAEELLHTAESQPLGWKRDVVVDLASVIADVADTTRLDRPRRWAETAIGDGEAEGRSSDPVVPVTTTLVPESTTVPGDGATTATVPELRRPTADAPLRVWIVGDSMMQVVGQSLVNQAADSGVIDTDLEFRISTGLTRPDYFDWPARLAAIVAEDDPEAMIVMFGANDAQGMALPDGPEQFGTDVWLAEYRRRTAEVMAQLSTGGRRIYWVGQPVMRSDSFSARMVALNDIYRSEAARVPDVTYVDSWTLFAVDGEYAAYIDDGGPTLMRHGDGIHLTRAGGDRLARTVLGAIRADWLSERP